MNSGFVPIPNGDFPVRLVYVYQAWCLYVYIQNPWVDNIRISIRIFSHGGLLLGAHSTIWWRHCFWANTLLRTFFVKAENWKKKYETTLNNYYIKQGEHMPYIPVCCARSHVHLFFGQFGMLADDWKQLWGSMLELFSLSHHLRWYNQTRHQLLLLQSQLCWWSHVNSVHMFW
jgi:hypothetical protein